MIDFASLAWFAVYGAAILGIGLALRQMAGWSDGTSVADPFGGGYRDLPWPRGVQEEEPVGGTWPRSVSARPTSLITGQDRRCSPVSAFAPRQAARPRA